MPRIKPKQVHLILTRHGPSNPFVKSRNTPLPKTKTFVYEQPRGEAPSKGDTIPQLFVGWHEVNKNTLATHAFIKNAHARKIKIVPGEQATPQQLSTLQKLQGQCEVNAVRLFKNLSLPYFKKYLQAHARQLNFREHLITRTLIENTAAGNVEAHYGRAHSTLRKKLQKAGIETSTEIYPKTFRLFDVPIRKLMLSQKPTELDYKKAFISGMIGDKLSKVLNAHSVQFLRSPSHHSHDFFALAENTIIQKLTTQQVDTILSECIKENRSELALPQVLTYVGLPLPTKYNGKEFRKAIVAFLEVNSTAWKRKKIVNAQ